MSQEMFEQFQGTFRYHCTSTTNPQRNLVTTSNIRKDCGATQSVCMCDSLCITATTEAGRGQEMEIEKDADRGQVEMTSEG